MNQFTKLGVHAKYLPALEELGIREPSPIQAAAIPTLLGPSADFIAQAQTGTGKTATFGLPLLMKVDHTNPVIQALVVAPTRELAKQIGKQLFRYTKGTEKVFIEVVTGGDNIDRQISSLQRPTHIVVCTPGRLLDLLERGALKLNSTKLLVLDEADEMLKLGFQRELARIFELTKHREAAWLFSATIPKGILNLITNYMAPGTPTLRLDQRNVVNADIRHEYIMCHRAQRFDRLVSFLNKHPEERGVLFCRTIASVMNLASQLAERGFAATMIHGEMHQLERDKAMRAFKKNRARLLVATDVAARGIDVEGLAFVVHCQLPDQIEFYAHRSGRTGRAGRTGLSLVFIEQGEKANLVRFAEALNLEFRERR
jgi:ATP-dependent RNA helicase DeaD